MTADVLMRRAIALAVENVSSGRGGPFGAVVACGGEVVAEGTNLVTSTHDPTAHAEVVAIRRACGTLQRYALEGCEIYASCEPCPMCLGAIYWARFDRLYFACTREDAAAASFDDSRIYDEVPLPPAERALPTQVLLRDEGQAAFRAWRESGTKLPY